MSSSSVCQGFQSCLEPRLFTPSKSIFSLSISPSSLSPSHTPENTTTTTILKTNDDCNMESEKAEDTGGWSFLQCLTNTTTTTKETADGNEKVYVHPFVKSSSSKLNEKSLEMCTESLGSETGSLTGESCSDDEVIIINTTSSAGIDDYTSTQLLRESNLVKKRTNRSLTFPPPLTSISCSNGVQVRPHREGGRLVLQAVTVPSLPPTCFQAERSDGRLRLCFVKDLDDPSPHEEEEEEEEVEEEDLSEVVYDDEDEELNEAVYDDEDGDCCDNVEDVEGRNEKDRGEIGIENLPTRSSRCSGCGRGTGNRLNWDEPFWVAT